MFALYELASYLDVPEASLNEQRAGLLHDLTEGLILSVTGALDPVPLQVKAVAIEVAARAYRNPQGAVQESLDDYSYRRPEQTTAAGVYLTDAEMARLLAVIGRGAVSYGSIRLVTPYGWT